MKVWPLVFNLTIPAVISQLITFLYNVVDRMYVANIKDYGMDALAALGIVLPITTIIQAFANLIGLGGSPKASMKLGENNKEEANKIFNISFLLLLIIGIILSIILFIFAKDIVILFGCPTSAISFATSYLKVYSLGTIFIIISQGLNPFITAQGYSFIAMISILIGALINIVLDPIFIFLLDMKVVGASLATIISQFFSFVWIMSFFISKKSIFRLKKQDMKLNSKRILSILSLGLSPFIMTITECAIQIVFNINLNIQTNKNKDYTAALTIMLSALQLISLPLNGLGYGMQPFVSYNYGNSNAKRLKEGIKDVTIIAFIYALIVYIISLTNPIIYAYMFNASESVTDIVVKYTPFFFNGNNYVFCSNDLTKYKCGFKSSKISIILSCFKKGNYTYSSLLYFK
ncbi:MAG: MATE family efflux transporter [Candidatus Caccosoma sp.]|nr:MATE family efflux transporter [Candidatus Caccosoma sp.]